MNQVSIALPSELEHGAQSRVAAGDHVDMADYVRDLLRRDRDDHAAEVRRVRALIDDGLASGTIDAEPEVVLHEIIAGIPAPHG